MNRRVAIPVVSVVLLAAPACQSGDDSSTEVTVPDPVVTTTSPGPPTSDTAPVTTTSPAIDEPVVESTVLPDGGDLVVDISRNDMVLQAGNDEPALVLQTVPSPELADNRSGVWWEDYSRFRDSDHIYDNGFTRTRIGSLLDASGTELAWRVDVDSLLPRVDDKITEYADHGIVMVLPLHQGTSVPMIIDEFTQDDIDQLLEMTEFVVDHFRGRIEYYEIWNEFGNQAEVDTYVDLIEQSAALIEQLDPNAKVIVGSIPGDWPNGEDGYGEYQRFIMNTTYFWALLDAIDFDRVGIDGISWHPFYDNIPTDEGLQSYPELVAEIKARATARGFSGEYYADEILWHTWDEPGFPHGPPVSKTIAAKFYVRTITEHRGLDVNVTINTFFQEPVMQHIRNVNNVLAGAEPTGTTSFIVEAEEELPFLRQYVFALPDGEILLAVWRHGDAVEYDRGVAATLTIPVADTSTVTGIDVFHGFEQPLVVEAVDGVLIVENLMVKDYPVFVRIGPAGS